MSSPPSSEVAGEVECSSYFRKVRLAKSASAVDAFKLYSSSVFLSSSILLQFQYLSLQYIDQHPDNQIAKPVSSTKMSRPYDKAPGRSRRLPAIPFGATGTTTTSARSSPVPVDEEIVFLGSRTIDHATVMVDT